MALTDTTIRNAKPTERPAKLFDNRGSGLYLLVQPTGTKLWRLKYRIDRKEKLLSLGGYPAVTLKEARDAAEAARRLIDSGTDPSLLRHASKAEREHVAASTFETVSRAWHSRWSKTRSEKHADQVIRRLEADIFPEIGSRPIKEVTAPMLIAVARKIEARGAHDIAHRAFQVCGQVLRSAVADGLIDRNPAADVRPSDALTPTVSKNYARLEPREVPELLRKIETYDGSAYTRLALRLMSLTFVRTSELIGARWDEFDLDAAEWRVPADRMKMKTPHVVPLSRQAVEVMHELERLRMGRELVFPGERDHTKPMSNNTVLFALYRMGYHSRMTGHGFRGIASTMLHEEGFDHAVIELQLAHTERNKVSAAYNHALYLPQRRSMMQWWADKIDAMRDGAKVLPFKAA